MTESKTELAKKLANSNISQQIMRDFKESTNKNAMEQAIFEVSSAIKRVIAVEEEKDSWIPCNISEFYEVNNYPKLSSKDGPLGRFCSLYRFSSEREMVFQGMLFDEPWLAYPCPPEANNYFKDKFVYNQERFYNYEIDAIVNCLFDAKISSVDNVGERKNLETCLKKWREDPDHIIKPVFCLADLY